MGAQKGFNTLVTKFSFVPERLTEVLPCWLILPSYSPIAEVDYPRSGETLCTFYMYLFVNFSKMKDIGSSFQHMGASTVKKLNVNLLLRVEGG